MRRFWRKISRPLRFALDALLALALLVAVYVALGCPILGETALFRRAEKANLMGPSKIIDRLNVPKDWPTVSWDRLLIGDDGEEIVFWTRSRGARSGSLTRMEKAEGILLTPLPGYVYEDDFQPERDMSAPLFLFADDPAAVKATVRIRLSETDEVTLTQVRGKLALRAGDAESRERCFFFKIPVPQDSWMLDRGEQVRLLLKAYEDRRPIRTAGIPVTIRLYDAEDRLIETREWTL
ncbi:MAG: hypothetical protein IKX47_05210 [Oscillospiraceae bacterium]|nr:hypothetical protein [Oscillospiraceae bacterium]